tara:strand:- start:6188 stop:7378 length:1191 start_codon:yes stop_codon:yes gene_type:complete
MRNLLIIVAVTMAAHATIRIQSPMQHAVTINASIPFTIQSTMNKGFYLINGHVMPLRKQPSRLMVPLAIGDNQLHVSFLNENRQLQPSLTKMMSVYRTLPIPGKVPIPMAMLITDMWVRYGIDVRDPQGGGLDRPILKRNAYALLMWFYRDQPKKIIPHVYHDMALFSHYMEWYQHYPVALPMPTLDRFFPNAYMTRLDVINGLLALNGLDEQVSTSLWLSPSVHIPDSVQSLLPSDCADNPLALVSTHSFIQILFAWHGLPQVRTPYAVTIDWPSVRRGTPVIKHLTHRIMDTWRGWVASRFVKQPKAVIKKPIRAVPPMMIRPSKESVVVVSGDSIQRIARRYYGSARYWRDIARHNELTVNVRVINGKDVASVHIVPGQLLQLPPIETKQKRR